MKTYEARSRIGLKLKIKQEAGLSKVIHNTALDPPGMPPGMPPGAPPPQQQLNGSLEKKPPPGAAPCRLPLRKTYREHRESPESREPARSERRPVITALRREPGAAPRLRGKGAPEEPSDGEDEEDEEGAGARAEPPELEPPWAALGPAGKRRKAEPLEVDNASFSSDSPQDDSLSEHLQSAIDSILNLQQPRNPPAPPFPAAARRSEPLLPPPSHNGGLGAARTCTR